jgi:hypothetical protein
MFMQVSPISKFVCLREKGMKQFFEAGEWINMTEVSW